MARKKATPKATPKRATPPAATPPPKKVARKAKATPEAGPEETIANPENVDLVAEHVKAAEEGKAEENQ